MRKILNLMFVFGLLLFVFSCNKKEVAPPKKISIIKGIAKNKSILLSWTKPASINFKKVRIVYGAKSMEIYKDTTEMLFENLDNGVEYSFSISAIDYDGNISEPVIVKATPDRYVTTVEGRKAESGYYEMINLGLEGVKFTCTVDNNKYKKSVANNLFREGEWIMKSDSSYVSDEEYYKIERDTKLHSAYVKTTANAVFSYDFSDETCYVAGGYQKIEGSNYFLEGKYKKNWVSISSDFPDTYSSNVSIFIEINKDGITKKIVEDGDSKTTLYSWTNKDLLAGKFIFVKFNHRIYLTNSTDRRYVKK